LGRAVAKQLSSLGAKIIVHGRDQARIDETLGMLAGKGHVGAPFDIANYETIPGWVSELVDKTGPLSGVVHSAGILTVAPLKVLSKSILGPMTDVNVNAGIMLARALRMPRNRGTNANIVGRRLRRQHRAGRLFCDQGRARRTDQVDGSGARP
jgi:NAD(P)-dependent dehydrogenase (short-subunit alcohol dehydrogenase family)